MQNQPKGKNRAWSLWGLIVFAPAVAIAISTYYVFPESFKIIGIMLIISVGVSAWILRNSDEPDAQIRRFGLNVKFALAFVLFLNLAVHVQVSRELSAANHSRVERHEEEDREQARKDQEARRKALEAEAKTKELTATAGLVEQTRKMNYGLKPSARIAAPVVSSPAESPLDPLAVPPAKTEPAKTIAAMVTPDDVRNGWSGWMFALAIIESLIAVVGGARLMVMLHWDADGNGIPDWMQKLSPEELWTRSPEHYAKMYPNRQPPTF